MEIQGQKQLLLQIEDYTEIVFRRKWYIIIPFVVSVIGIIVALILIHPMYKSSTLILVEPQKVPEAYVKSTVTLGINERLNTLTQQVMSRTRLESIIKEFSLYGGEKEQSVSEEIIEGMRKHIQINVKGRDSFVISYEGSNPEIVMFVTNRLASLFIEDNLKVREQQAEGTTEFLDGQLQHYKLALEGQETQIRKFKEKYLGELPSQLEASLRTLDRMQLDLKANNETLMSLDDRKIMLEKQLAEVNSYSEVLSDIRPITGGGQETSGLSDPLNLRLAKLHAELSQLSSIYTDKYPDIMRLRNEIAMLEKQMEVERSSYKASNTASAPTRSQGIIQNPRQITLSTQLMELTSDIKNLKIKQNEITNNINLFQRRVENMPAREQQMTFLLRDYENTRTNYQNILNKKLDAQLAENLEKRQKGEQFRILDPASLPVKPFKPDPKKIVLLGLALGLGCGVGLVFLLEFIDSSFRKPDDVYAIIGIPVLASVPRIDGR